MRLGFVGPLLLAGLLLVGCATAYGPEQMTGGFSQQQLETGRWRVVFSANGYTTRETAQTYWLYHCAELTLAQGYDDFEIVTPIDLTAFHRQSSQAPYLTLTHGGGGGTVVFVPIYGGAYNGPPKPRLQAEIRMQRRPFSPTPPKSFDAAALLATLKPIVTGPKCDGNVCPHRHDYLYAPERPAQAT